MTVRDGGDSWRLAETVETSRDCRDQWRPLVMSETVETTGDWQGLQRLVEILETSEDHW